MLTGKVDSADTFVPHYRDRVIYRETKLQTTKTIYYGNKQETSKQGKPSENCAT